MDVNEIVQWHYEKTFVHLVRRGTWEISFYFRNMDSQYAWCYEKAGK